jgi:hypothetical protein
VKVVNLDRRWGSGAEKRVVWVEAVVIEGVWEGVLVCEGVGSAEDGNGWLEASWEKVNPRLMPN